MLLLPCTAEPAAVPLLASFAIAVALYHSTLPALLLPSNIKLKQLMGAFTAVHNKPVFRIWNTPPPSPTLLLCE